MRLIAQVERLEAKLRAAQLQAATALRRCREQAGLSLRDVAEQPAVGLSAAGLSLLERAETWETATAKRVLAFYQPATEAPPDPSGTR